jgi:hypothetical protein
LFPSITPVGYREAVATALSRLEAGQVETRWSDAVCSSQGEKTPVMLKTREGMIIERREKDVSASPEDVFRVFTSLGGERGWLYMDWTWRLRGILDRLLGGAGLRRGRRDPRQVRVGDAVDFWRVEEIDQNRSLRLRAEMILPGRAWLQFDVKPINGEKSRLVQTAYFAPRGLAGFLYWYVLYPAHSLIFSGLIGRIKAQAEQQNEQEEARVIIAE